MDKLQTFQEFVATQNIHMSMWDFMLNMMLTAFLSFLLGWIYIRYGQCLSNRKIFARNFILLAMTTMLIISIVKSSLALSLGLVGALSIVRFRSAIKEPEELLYLFMAISIGLGFGADQRAITTIAFIFIAIVIWIKHLSFKSEMDHNLYITVSSHNPRKLDLSEIVDILNANCTSVDIKRFDENKETVEALFLVEYDNFDKLNNTKDQLQALNESVHITFLDNRGINL